MLYKDMTPEDLRSAYATERTIAYNSSQMAQSVSPRNQGRRKVARSWGRAMRNVEMIEAIARKRGIRL